MMHDDSRRLSPGTGLYTVLLVTEIVKSLENQARKRKHLIPAAVRHLIVEKQRSVVLVLLHYQLYIVHRATFIDDKFYYY